MARRKSRRGLIAAGVGASFLTILAVVGWLAAREIVTPQMAVLLGVTTFGLYVGFGILIAVFSMINKLE